ncbi:hypothetical protein OIU79_028922, partial [Salix purpurea]
MDELVQINGGCALQSC